MIIILQILNIYIYIRYTYILYMVYTVDIKHVFGVNPMNHPSFRGCVLSWSSSLGLNLVLGNQELKFRRFGWMRGIAWVYLLENLKNAWSCRTLKLPHFVCTKWLVFVRLRSLLRSLKWCASWNELLEQQGQFQSSGKVPTYFVWSWEAWQLGSFIISQAINQNKLTKIRK